MNLSLRPVSPPRRLSGRAPRRGFTLIEALAAIAVLVIVIPVLLTGFDIAGNLASTTRKRTEASELARSTMDELLATGEWQNGSASGEENRNNTVYSWEAVLSDWPEATAQGLTDVQQLDVHVRWIHRGREQELTLSTVVYAPSSTTSTVSGSGLP